LRGESDVSKVSNGGARVVGNTTVCNGGVGVASGKAVGNGETTAGEIAIHVESIVDAVFEAGEAVVGMTTGCCESPLGITTGSWRAEFCTFAGAAGEVPCS